MNGLSNFKSNAKRTSAVILAALIVAGGAQSALLSANAAQVDTNASSAGVDLSSQDRHVLYANSRTDFRDESIYFLITTRFYDGDTSNNARTSEDKKAQNPENDPSWRGDFKGLIDKLDYIKALGFTAIWITPVVENNSGYDYHGYHAYDFSAVDTRYESNGVTYQTLIDACHAKGIKVIQDIVVNHTCNWGEKNLLQITNEVYGGGRSNYVMPAGDSLDPGNIYHHTGFCGGGDWDNQEAQRKTIADDCFDLNTENPTVYNYLVDCYTNYINMGVDGFRVDTVKHVNRLTFNSVFLPAFKRAGGEKFYMFGEICTKGHDVWYRGEPGISTCFYTWADDASWTGRWSNDTAANTALINEHYAAHSDIGSQPTSTNAFLNGNEYHTPDNSVRSGMDAIDFQMHWSFNSANEAYNTALGEDQYFADSTWNVVYVDSHDYGPDNCQTLRYNFGTDAWAENLSLMFTFRGIPCIYYGSEIEFQAGKPIDVGPNQPLANTGRAYYGDHIEGNVNTTGFTVFDGLSGEVKNTLNSTLSQHIMRLNRLRQAIPALRKGQYSTEGCSGNMAFKRRYTDSTTDSFACVAISGSATFSGIPNGRYVDAVTGDVQNVSGGTLTANCSGKGNLRVYVLDTAKTPAPGRVIPNGDYLNDGGAATLIGEEIIDGGDTPTPVDPTGISLSDTTLSVGEGKTATIKATVSPSNASNKSVTWTSSNNAVATVSGGTIKGVKKGTATITATTSNGLTATCKVTVTESVVVNPTAITLDKTALSLEVGDSSSLSATVSPSNADDPSVTWTSSNASVASVTNGTVKALKAGTAVITASTCNGIEAACTVTVKEKSFEYVDEGFYFEKPSGWGSTINVYFFNKSSNTTVGASWPGTQMKSIGSNVYSLAYQIPSDSNVVMIFNDGNNQSPGQNLGGFEVKNQGYYTSNGFDHIVEKVTTVDVTSVTLNKTSLTLEAGGTSTLSATAAPSNATDKTITWTSSNNSVAKVSSTGVVTAVAAGTATIKATASSGVSASCTVTVTGGQETEELLNNSTVSATSVTKGDTITITGKASGGTGGYKYKFSYKRASQSSYTVKSDYGKAASVTLTPAYAEKYTVRVDVKDSSGTITSKTFTISVSEGTSALTNNSTVSATQVKKGTTVTITGKASGGASPYKYRFSYKRSSQSSYTVKSDYGKATSVTLTPSYVDTYTVKVDVKDNTNSVKTKTFTINSISDQALVNNSTVSATSVTKGTTVTITGKASGGAGSYKYEFLYKRGNASSWTTKSAYGKATSVTLTPAYADTYYIMVNAKDSAGTVKSKIMTVTSTDTVALANNSTVSTTSVVKGSSVVITGKASGGTSPYKYRFSYKRSGQSSYTVKSDYGKATSVTLTPAYVDTYTVKIDVKDNNGTVKTKTITVNSTAAAELKNNSSLSATSVKTGTTVTIKGAASGGTGSYTYAYYYKKSNSSQWITKGTEFGTAKSVTLTPGTAVNYNIKVVVRDSSGETVTKTFTLKVS